MMVLTDKIIIKLRLFRPVIEPDLPGAFLTKSPEDAYERNEVAPIPFIASNTREEAEFIRIGNNNRKLLFVFFFRT